MKTRNGFIANSSSTCFILDARKLSEEVFNKIKQLPQLETVGRGTGANIEKQVKEFALHWNWDSFDDQKLGDWILSKTKKLGKNVVLIREGDDYDSYFKKIALTHEEFQDAIIAEREYH